MAQAERQCCSLVALLRKEVALERMDLKLGHLYIAAGIEGSTRLIAGCSTSQSLREAGVTSIQSPQIFELQQGV